VALGAVGGAVRHDGPWRDQLVAHGWLPASGGGADLVLDCVGKVRRSRTLSGVFFSVG
jgi:hypothetical protein